ncbi:DeoR/GlpR family DNA-binding transcription regulator [Roseovarius sp. Pro17]|uniref:DeoR/GlpR family DNA-binding transcription regulator n=1 Tax=Roseovarius sp. Pro17 TaxID=3108175 RepID=UPI002D77F585|nr:DeoR/GlpR family DNA-binding transcription regulator [Roseovarius sp. Pro17]
MLPSQRHQIILREVSSHPAVSIRDLTEALGVSRETVRKDIELLAADNQLRQVRGGATRILTSEPPTQTRAATNPEGKARIAHHVAQRIGDGASLFIDNGLTTLAVALVLAQCRQRLTIYTNDLKIAEIIAPAAREVTVLGGRLDLAETATFGIVTLEQLSHYRAEFALIGAGGVSARALFTDFSREAAEMRLRMMRQAEEALILTDSSKFGEVGQVVLGPLPKGARMVSDLAPPDDIAAALRHASIGVDIAGALDD